MSGRKKTPFKGVRYREHPTRKNGVKKDQYFSIRYRLDGKSVEEALGWASEGYTAAGAYQTLCELKKNRKQGGGPESLSEKRKEAGLDKKRKEAANISFRDFFTEIYQPFVKATKINETGRKEEEHARRHLIPAFGEIPIKDVSVSPHLERLVSSMRDREYSKRFIQYVLGTFQRVWRKAYESGIVSGQVPKIKIGPLDNQRQGYLKPEEGDALIKMLLDSGEQRAADISTVLLDLGLRPSELFALSWDRIDLESGTVLVANTKSKKDRTLPVTTRVKEVFSRLSGGRRYATVFTTREGTPIKRTPRVIEKALDSLVEGNRERDVKTRLTPYSLRHSFGSVHMASGTNPFIVQRLMGHSTPLMTARYSHAAFEQLRDAQAQMENYSRQRSKKIKILRTKSA